MTATKQITGIVAGFVLVIDPENEKGKLETIRFDDATKMSACMSELTRSETAYYKANPRLNYDPTETRFWTEYKRDDNGQIEKEFSYDPSGNTKVGGLAYRMTCKCSKNAWFIRRPSEFAADLPATSYICEDCPVSDDTRIHDHDFTNYDGMQEREY
ncbi:MAG: hypothetical protein V4473_02380 [Patescibacteria group bacterium]